MDQSFQSRVQPAPTSVPKNEPVSEQVLARCSIAAADYLDVVLQQHLPQVKDSQGADVTERTHARAHAALSKTIDHLATHARAQPRSVSHPAGRPPENRPAQDVVELIGRLRDGQDTFGAMLAREGLQGDSWSASRRQAHSVLRDAYPHVIAQTVHALYGAPLPVQAQGQGR